MERHSGNINREAERNLKTVGIPPCPMVLTTLVREMRAEEPDFMKIGKLLSADVGLAAAMLKTVNSPFYGLSAKATSVQRALALLGLRNVAQLVTGLLLRQAFPATDDELMEQFWHSSSATAAIMAALAPRFDGVERDEAHTFGLFRCCGIPVMMLFYPEYPKLYRQALRTPGTGLMQLEEAQFGSNHARIGFELAQNWYLPDHSCRAILWHHDSTVLGGENTEVPVASRLLIALGMLGEALYRSYSDEAEAAEWTRGGVAALAQLNLEADEFELLLAEVPAIVEEA